MPWRIELRGSKLCNVLGGCHRCGIAEAAAVKDAATAADKTTERGSEEAQSMPSLHLEPLPSPPHGPVIPATDTGMSVRGFSGCISEAWEAVVAVAHTAGNGGLRVSGLMGKATAKCVRQVPAGMQRSRMASMLKSRENPEKILSAQTGTQARARCGRA